MITKIIACADIHIPSYTKIGQLHTTLESFIDSCKKIVKENGKKNTVIVLGGDIYDSKLNITNESLLEANWFFSELNDICRTYVIAGNHDLTMSNLERIDSLTPLFEVGKYKNVVYLDKELGYKSGTYTIKDDGITFCLFSTFDAFNRPSAELEIDKKQYPDNTFVGLIHGDINGAITTTSWSVEDGIETTLFDGCDFVIAGHIHKRQEIKKNGIKAVYCSSLKQKDFGESITGHGFVVWNRDEDGEWEYEYKDIEQEEGGFYKFVINSPNDIENDNEELLNY